MKKTHTFYLDLKTEFQIENMSEEEALQFVERFVQEAIDEVENATDLDFQADWNLVEDE